MRITTIPTDARKIGARRTSESRNTHSGCLRRDALPAADLRWSLASSRLQSISGCIAAGHAAAGHDAIALRLGHGASREKDLLVESPLPIAKRCVPFHHFFAPLLATTQQPKTKREHNARKAEEAHTTAIRAQLHRVHELSTHEVSPSGFVDSARETRGRALCVALRHAAALAATGHVLEENVQAHGTPVRRLQLSRGCFAPVPEGEPDHSGVVTADVMAGCMGGGTTVGVISTSVTAGYVVVVLLLVGGGGGGAAAASSP
eukprot:CAMPEP_0205962898 /NCGR_PEP_ID=MMETSP1459-20131121/70829_1 /ASSEMBLY_ACC=CAM_ASM_001120 /TAXON_ID=41880 /ORGANISM="Pycnococcus provasolii, Strain RCC931" /LENGTH=260 /DNA_ID=CAMNT_0053335683 /DNA_START=1265 /DNA_END=2049 /DNA_ORIENTATION=-